jgi:gamma-butyrobetaine dioxygenase
LARYFGPEVSEPVRWHVDAKRYLCATEPAYLDGLSDASKLSLELQGGPFDSARADRFAAQPFADRAIAVRRWDDAGKIEGLRVRDMAGYRPLMRSLLSAGTGRAGC